MGKKDEGDLRLVELRLIRIDGGTQSRVGLDEQTAEDYAALYRARKGESACDALPEVECVFDGSAYWLYDGFHRYHGAAKAGLKALRVRFLAGTVQDARWLAAAANTKHGLRRTNADKRRAVEMAFASLQSQGLSDRAIADHCGVSNNFVSEIRRQVSSDDTSKRKGLDGKSYPAGRKPKPPADPDDVPFDPPPETEEDDEPEVACGPDALPPEEQQAIGEKMIAAARAGTLPEVMALDAVGNVVPSHLADVFADQKMREQLARVRGWRESVEHASAGRRVASIAPYYGAWVNPLLVEQFLTEAYANLAAAEEHLERCLPYALCPHCIETAAGCESCRKVGWVPRWRHEELAEQERLTEGKPS